MSHELERKHEWHLNEGAYVCVHCGEMKIIREWYVLKGRTGHRSVTSSHVPNDGERFVDFIPRSFEDSRDEVDSLDLVEKVLSS